MTRLTKFTLTYAGTLALLFAVASFLVSLVVGAFSWRDVAIGFAVGGAIALCRAPEIIRDEIQRVYVALLQEWVAAVLKQSAEQGVELDVAALHRPVLRATQAKLEESSFQSIDVGEELRP